MSHFSCLVLVDRPITRAEANEAIKPLLAPYNENGVWFAEGSRWDWWQVGGRWTGRLDNYNPTTDPNNIVDCALCGATGFRLPPPDVGPGWIKCNGCENGRRVQWPTNWAEHEGDVCPVANLSADITAHAMITPDGKWHEAGRMGWFGIADEDSSVWPQVMKKLLAQWPNAYAVIVDCHV